MKINYRAWYKELRAIMIQDFYTCAAYNLVVKLHELVGLDVTKKEIIEQLDDRLLIAFNKLGTLTTHDNGLSNKTEALYNVVDIIYELSEHQKHNGDFPGENENED